MNKNITRRNLIAGAAATSIAAAMPLTAQANEITWEAEADIVIVGGGAAGFSALATVYCEDLGSALLLEVANEDEAGGNSRVCGQGVFCPKTVEAAIAYQNKCNGSYVVAPELMQAWAENICENVEWMAENVDFHPEIKGGAEFPELDESDGEVVWYAHEGKGPWAHTWQLFVDCATEYDAPVYYETRGTELIWDANGEICGVECEDGRCFKANKGVILATGGFENDQDMMNNYMEIGFPGYKPQGSIWNRGDGIRMAMSAGADLWHMNNVSGNAFEVKCVDPETDLYCKYSLKNDEFIEVSSDGTRFHNEKDSARHGKVYRAGTWCGRTMPEFAYCIMTEAAAEEMKINGSWVSRTDGYEIAASGMELVDRGIMTKCDTVADVAALIGADETVLAAEIDAYNSYCETGVDPDFHREIIQDADNPAFANTGDNAEHVDLFPVSAPYYVVRIFGSILNTQGGPRRGAKGEVLNVKGEPIPRLYAAGEMGCIYGYAYNLGGNFSEAISSGRLAARSISALEPLA